METALAATAAQSAHDAWNVKGDPVAGTSGSGDNDADIIACGFPFDDSRPARASNLLGVHFEFVVLIERSGQFGDMLPTVPGDEANQAPVRLQRNVPVQPGAAANGTPGMECVKPRFARLGERRTKQSHSR